MTDHLDTTENDAHDADAVEDRDDSLEAIAREAGWKPESELERKPKNFLPPAEYIRRTAREAREAREAADQARKELRRVGATTDRMVAEARREAREAAERDLQAAKDAGDPEAAADAARRLERSQAPQPEVAAWVSKNASWFNVNTAAQHLAQGVAAAKAQEGASVAEQLDAAEAEVRRVYPNLFPDAEKREERQERKAPPSTQGGSRQAEASRGGAKGYADLSPDAKRAYQAYVDRQKPDKRDSAGKYWIKSYYEANS